jgi:hypothetical protein
MIVRHILKEPEYVIERFDFFNDATDTLIWLKSLRTEEADRVAKKLNAEFRIWLNLTAAATRANEV